MAAAKKPIDSGSKQAAKPRKVLKSGVSPDVGKKTQFKPGQSGNPAGKPPGTKHLSTWIQELLHDEEFTTTIRRGLKLQEFKGAPIKAIVMAQLELAVQGDQKAFDLLGKYGFGTKVELTGPEGGPVQALVTFVDGDGSKAS